MPRCIDCQYQDTDYQIPLQCVCLKDTKAIRTVLNQIHERKCSLYKLGIMHNVQSRKDGHHQNET